MMQVDNIVEAYKTLAKIPSIIAGNLNKSGNKVTSLWNTRNLDKGKNVKYTYSYALNEKLEVVAESDFGSDCSNELLSAVSPLETYKALIREEKDKKDVKKQYLEVWKANTLANCIDLTALDKHGDVYADSEFGSLGWSADESLVTFVAERKPPKYEPYIKRKPEDPKPTDGCGEKQSIQGEEYTYRQDWGEQLQGKHLSVIVVCDINKESVKVLEGLPESWCPGQVKFSEDGKSVFGVAWESEPRRLGLIFCTNRQSHIFNLTLDGVMSKITRDGLSVRSPRLSPAGDLVWLQRESWGPHHACHSLVIRKANEEQIRTIIDIVHTKVKIENGETFYGIYCQALPKNCFCTDGNRIIFSTQQKHQIKTYVAYVDSGKMVDISNNASQCSTTVLDVKSDTILATCSSVTTPAQLYIARLPAPGLESQITWTSVSKAIEVPTLVSKASVKHWKLRYEDSNNDIASFSALFCTPKDEDKNMPIIVWPHGGPHSQFVNAYALETALFLMLGYSCLQVNYRGSSGAGDASLRSLLGQAGTYDVTDCKMATDYAINKMAADKMAAGKKLVLFGGSHGGFLVTHLSGQFPDLYKAVVARNPVTDIATMINTTDIEDW